jgi:hypothetical protein
MTLERDLFDRALQQALEAGAWVERVVVWENFLSVVVPAGRALGVARLLSSTAEGSRHFGVI